jgi:hypothetical protein
MRSVVVVVDVVVGAAKGGRRSCTGWMPVLHRVDVGAASPVPGAARGGHQSCKGRAPELQASSPEMHRVDAGVASLAARVARAGARATRGRRRSCKGRAAVQLVRGGVATSGHAGAASVRAGATSQIQCCALVLRAESHR